MMTIGSVVRPSNETAQAKEVDDKDIEDARHDEHGLGEKVYDDGSSTSSESSQNTAVTALSNAKKGCKISIFVVVFFAALFIMGITGYVLYSGNNVDIPLTDLTALDIADVFMEDPWEYGFKDGKPKSIFWRKDNGEGKNGGLDLTLVNALTNDWQEIFDSSVNDWEYGEPDALTLQTTFFNNGDSSNACDAVVGQMKVCNDDFGETGWKGLNEALVTSENVIVSSVAKMNEYYLRDASYEERRYTMCHELGHGFGLNHADEYFRNPDMGTCMDYTDSPGNNLTPNTKNYETLADAYGTVPSQSTKVNTVNSSNNTDTIYVAAVAVESNNSTTDNTTKNSENDLVRRLTEQFLGTNQQPQSSSNNDRDFISTKERYFVKDLPNGSHIYIQLILF